MQNLKVNKSKQKPQILQDSFKNNGYLYLKQYLNTKAALRTITKLLVDEGKCDVALNTLPISSDMPSTLQDSNSKPGFNLMSRQDWIASDQHIHSLLESDKIAHMMDLLSTCSTTPSNTCSSTTTSRPSVSQVQKKKKRSQSSNSSSKLTESPQPPLPPLKCFIPFKWLRAVPKGLHTGLHRDSFYTSYIHSKIITVWIAISDVEIERGALVVAEGSHSSPSWRPVHELYSNTPGSGDGTTEGWVATSPSEIFHLLDPDLLNSKSHCLSEPDNEQKKKKIEQVFKTTNFKKGDVVFLDGNVFHMTAVNQTGKVRITCDVRWICL